MASAEEAIEQYLGFLEAAGVGADLPEVSPAVVTDPDDDPILHTAIVGHADVLCSREEAFQHEIVERVCAAHGMRILDDITLLQELSPVEHRVNAHAKPAKWSAY